MKNLAWISLVASLVFGCSTSSNGDGAGGTAGKSTGGTIGSGAMSGTGLGGISAIGGAGSGGTMSAGGTPGTSGGALGVGGASDKTYFGRVDFELITEGTAAAGFTAYRYFVAEFAPSQELQSILTCGPGTVPETFSGGQCCYLPPSASPVITAVSAGTLTTSFFGQAGSGTLETISYADGYAAGDAGVWSSGDDVTVSASGDTIPAFTATVKSPSVNLTSGTPMTASVSAACNIQWLSPSPQVPVMVVLYSQDRTPLVKCAVNIGGSGVMVPASLMSHFTASETGILEVVAVATTTVTLANATVEVAALAGNSVPVTYTP